MSDDFNSKIKQIADLLGQEGMSDNLKGLMSVLAASMNKGDSAAQNKSDPTQNPPQPPAPIREEKAGKNELDESIDMIRKVRKIMDRLNTRDDPRINLLTAIQPFLNNKRQKRLANCIKILHMSRLASFVDENDKGAL